MSDRSRADAVYAALLDRYAREYQSLKSLQLASFSVDADIESKKAQAGVDAVGRVTIDVRRVGGSVEIVVSDTGPGIDPAVLPHVFERATAWLYDYTPEPLPSR